jgi:hypothetical protein
MVYYLWAYLLTVFIFMELTYFLAQLLGLYLLVVGLLMIFQKKMVLEVINECYANSALMFLAGWVAIFLGLLMVLIHNYWNVGVLALVVTLSGWAALLKGAALLFIPKTTVRWVRAANLEKMFYGYAIIVLIVGLYLTHAGFTHTGLLY